MLQEIALLTGSKTITKGIDIELKNTQISDLGHAGKSHSTRTTTLVEGKTKYEQLFFEREPCLHSSVHISPEQSSRTHAAPETHETPSARATPRID
jgi:chaperonin GroEL (HSP60 family)